MKHSGARTIILGIVIVAALVAGAYFIGLRQGRSDMAVQKSAFEKQISELQRGMALAESRTALAAARMSLYRTAFDLEQKNFGLANSHLREAASSLSLVSPALIGADAARFEEVRRTVSNLKLEVGSNTDEQKKTVLDSAAQLDVLVKPPPKAEIKPSAPSAMPPASQPSSAPAPASPR